MKAKRSNYYRTLWLMAHNALHDVVHKRSKARIRDAWRKYRTDLRTAEKVACTPA